MVQKAGGFIDIRLVGDKKLTAALKALPLKFQKKVVRKALRDAAKIVLPVVRANTPIDTGNLKNSIRVKALKFSRRSGKFGVGVQTGIGFYIGKQFYGAFQELGTRKMRGRRFMRDAADTTRTRAQAAMAATIAKGIEVQAAKTNTELIG